MDTQDVEIAVIGAGIAGIAAAYFIGERHGARSIALIDAGQPMALTSAQSGENYRNWWPHPVMTDLTDHSIDLMEQIARDSGDRLKMSRRGYVLATRSDDIGGLIEQLYVGYGTAADRLIRLHEAGGAKGYRAESAGWESAPDGVDVVRDVATIRRAFPSYDRAIRNILHIRKAGHIDGQQMGQFMLERLKDRGVRRVTGRVVAIERGRRFAIELRSPDGDRRLSSDVVVNAAGPFVGEIAGMLGVELPVKNVLQQKIAFEDAARAIPPDPAVLDRSGRAGDRLDRGRARPPVRGRRPGATDADHAGRDSLPARRRR